MAIIASRNPYYIEATTTDLVVKVKTWNDSESEPTEYQHQVDKSTNGGPATDFRVDVSQFIRPYFDMEPHIAPISVVQVYYGEFLNVKISVNDVEETHNAVYGYVSPIDEAFYDHWQTVKRIHPGTDMQVSLPPGPYTLTWDTDDGQSDSHIVGASDRPNTARVSPLSFDLSTANTLSISTGIHTYNYDVVCPFMDATIGFVNETGMWEYFDVNGRHDETYNREADQYIPYSTGKKTMLNVNGGITVRFNTGWVDEEFRRVIQPFMMSEHIIWAYSSAMAEMVLDTNSLRRQRRKTDKMINYSFTCELSDMVISPSGSLPSFLDTVI